MPSFVDLYDEHGGMGRFDIPNRITGDKGASFILGMARKGGGNGVVFEARQDSQRFNPPCAVKILRRQDSVRIDRFENEVRIQAALNHPRIARLIDNGILEAVPQMPERDGGKRLVPWAAMELGDSNLRLHVEQEGPLPAAKLVETALDMCGALGHLHDKAIIHRDIKPDNFVWSRRDRRAVMIDFGIAKYIGEDVAQRPLDQFTVHMEFVGPVFFSSPELIEYSRDKKHRVDHRSDLFQLAKVIWFLATNRISAGIPSKRLCPFGGALHAIVCECLHEDPDDRPASAGELADRLRGLPVQ